MNSKQKMIASGLAGAALATAVLVTVYEGRVLAETKLGKTAVEAGARVSIGSDGRPIMIADAPALDARSATREQLIARAELQQQQIAQLRAKLSELDKTDSAAREPDDVEPGRAWHDPGPDTLKAWAAKCHVRLDEPGLSPPHPYDEKNNGLGLEPSEVVQYNAAVNEVAKNWKALLRSLYIEATGDAVGADALSVEAMRNEIMEKSAPGEYSRVLYKISHERAGLQPPPSDLSRTSPLERMLRAWVQLGDQSEAALAKRLGAERAKAIRGDGWTSRHDTSSCPEN